jgi:hypothetical protein
MAEAAKVTRAEGSARFSMRASYRGEDLFHADGLARLDRERGRMNVTYDTELEGVPAGTELTMVIDGDEGYVRLPGKRKWIHVPDTAEDPTFSTGMSESLGYLGAVTDDAESAGETTVRGRPAHLYSATVDLDRVAENLPADERDAYREGLERHELDELPMEAAIDDDGRIVRMTYEVDYQGEELNFSFDLFDFGAKGDLSVPVRSGK